MKKTLMVALLPLVGCAVQAPTYVVADDPTEQCLKVLRTGYITETLGPKTNIGSPSPLPTLAQQDDKTYASEEERKALSMYADGRRQCLAAGEAYRSSHIPPAIDAAMSKGWADIDRMMVKLYAREITFGQFNQMRMENRGNTIDAIAAATSQVNQQNAQAQAAEVDRRQAAANAFVQGMQTQQAIQAQRPIYQPVPVQPLPRRTTTNCYRFGDQLNCTTY